MLTTQPCRASRSVKPHTISASRERSFITLIRDGRIKTVKIGTRTIVRGAELERFLDQQQAA